MGGGMVGRGVPPGQMTSISSSQVSEAAVDPRLRLMARAQGLGNVSQACREIEISRSPLYRWRMRYLAYGRDGLHPRPKGARRGRPRMLRAPSNRAILAVAATYPAWGPVQRSLQLRRSKHGRRGGSRLHHTTCHDGQHERDPDETYGTPVRLKFARHKHPSAITASREPTLTLPPLVTAGLHQRNPSTKSFDSLSPQPVRPRTSSMASTI